MDILNADDLSEERVRKLISHLRPDRELYSGRKFFEKLLDYAGVEGVVDFVNKGSKALSDKGELDLYFDFNDVERDAFNKARINYMSRRGFLGVFAVAGAALALGTAAFADDPVKVAFVDAEDTAGAFRLPVFERG